MQQTGSEKPTVKSTLIDFLAAPLYVLVNISLWGIALMTGRYIVLIEMEKEDEQLASNTGLPWHN